MKIELKNIAVGELVEGYVDKADQGVRGQGGRLNIRRPDHRDELISKDSAGQRGHVHRARRLPDEPEGSGGLRRRLTNPPPAKEEVGRSHIELKPVRPKKTSIQSTLAS